MDSLNSLPLVLVSVPLLASSSCSVSSYNNVHLRVFPPRKSRLRIRIDVQARIALHRIAVTPLLLYLA